MSALVKGSWVALAYHTIDSHDYEVDLQMKLREVLQEQVEGISYPYSG